MPGVLLLAARRQWSLWRKITAQIFALVAFMQYLRVLFVAGAAVLVTRMMLGDNAEAVNQQIVWFPPVSINLLLTILLAVVAGTAGCLLRLPSGTMLIPMLAGAVLQSGQSHHHRTTRMAAGDGVHGKLVGGLVLVSINKYYCGHCAHCHKSCCRFLLCWLFVQVWRGD